MGTGWKKCEMKKEVYSKCQSELHIKKWEKEREKVQIKL